MTPKLDRETLKCYADLAHDSDDELGAIGGNRLMSYANGWNVEVKDEETALFLASARQIVIDLTRRVVVLETAIEAVLADEESGAGGWGPDVTMVEVLQKALEGEPTRTDS